MDVSRRSTRSSRKSLRAQRNREEREQRLVIRHRWYAGGIATVLSAALIFAGMTPAVAGEVVDPEPAATQAAEEKKADPAPEPTTEPKTEPTKPADDPKPAETTPVVVPTPEETLPADDGDDLDKPSISQRSTPEINQFLIAPEDGGGGVQPLATSSTTDLTVRARVTAQPLGVGGSTGVNYTNTAGTRFQLYTYTNLAAGPQAAIADSWATCTIVANGECTITVPNTNSTTGGGNQGKRFWVVEIDPAPGTDAANNTYYSKTLLLGSVSGPTNTRHIAGLTRAMTANTTQNLPFVQADIGDTWPDSGSFSGDVIPASFGAVANSLKNKVLAPSCTTGLKIAILADESSSISSSDWTQFRSALMGAGGLFNSLTGTGSSIAYFSFSTDSPASGSNYPTLLPLDTQRAAIDAQIRTTHVGGSTNWDRGLRAVANANAANHYDVLLFITDGAPNNIANAAGSGAVAVSGTDVTLRSLEAAIYSANAIKAQTRLLAVGVGAGVSGAGVNLRAVSGTAPNEDYYQSASWDALKGDLASIAQGLTCQVPIKVTKTQVSATGVETPYAANWEFSAAKASGSGTLGAPAPANGKTVAGANGFVQWVHSFSATGQTATVTITETPQPGWVIQSVSCNNQNVQLNVQLNGNSWTVPSFGLGASISCTVKNTQQTAKFTFMKYGASQNALAGGSFQLYSGTAPNGTAVGAPFAAVAGGYTSGPLALGSYYIVEVTPPTGYLANSTPVSFTLSAGDVATPKAVSMTNVPAYKDLTVTKTAVPSFSRDYDWTILKSVDKTSANVRPGQNSAFNYTVTATPSAAQDSNFKVTGKITVTNPNNVAVPFTVSDTLPSASCAVTSPPASVAANSSVQIDYSCTLNGATPTTTGTNTANVQWTAASFPGTSGAASGTANFNFANATPAVTDASVEVTDTAPEFAAKYTTVLSRTATAPGAAKVFTYTRNLGSDVTAGACKDYPNTASIPATTDQVKLDSSVSVKVCTGANLTVSKTVVSSLTRTYKWSLDKSVDQTTRTVDANGNATFNYTVVATALPYQDSNWAMAGKITVNNPNAWPVTVTVTDAPSFGANVSCAVVGGVGASIPAAGSTVFDYSCTFSATAPTLNGSNEASITWDAAAAFTSASTASQTVPVAAAAWNETPVNKTVTIVDDKTNPAVPVTLGTATWGVDTPKTFTYSVTLAGTPNQCVDFTNKTWLFELPSVKDDQKVTVCAYKDLTVSKTANPTFDREYSFKIDKQADKTRLDVDPATGKATAHYTVTVTDGAAADSNFKVSGSITVTNPNNIAVTLTSIDDAIGATNCTVTAPNLVVPAAGTLVVPYTCTLAGATASTEGTNKVDVTWNTAGLTGSTGAASGTKGFAFTNANITDKNAKTVTVVDDKTNPAANPLPVLGTHTWSAKDASQSYQYDLELTGTAGKCVDFTNTAAIKETQQKADETVTVCAFKDLTVSKTVVPSFARDYDWTILKSVDKSSATVVPGATAAFAYTVTVTPSAAQDSNFKVVGKITVTNPNEVAVPLTGVTDVIPGATCVITTSPIPSVPANGSIDVEYTCTMGIGTTAGSSGTNTATVTWSPEVVPTTSGTASGTKPYSFTAATPVVTDASATVSDTAAEFGGVKTVQAVDGVKEFTYTRNLGAAAGGCTTYPNTATVDPSSSVPTTSSASVSVCAPTGSIEKDVTSVVANIDGTWTVNYSLRVSNPSTSGVAFAYDLRDTFDFGDGFTVIGSPSVTGPAGVTLDPTWNGSSQSLLAAGVSLAANAGGTATHTYNVSVNVDFDSAVEEPGLICEQGEPGAFRNVGAVYPAGQRTALDEDDACAEPKTPTFTKVADPAGPTQNANGTWTVKYILRVTNPTYNTPAAQSMFYSLTDISGASLSGDITLTGAGWVASGPGASATWDGVGNTTLVTAAVIGAGEQYREYTITGTIKIAPSVSAAQLTCDPQGGKNTGIVNTATLTHTFGTIPGRACVSIEPPTVSVAKTAKSVAQNADGTWLVTYLVSVTNDSTTKTAVYDLDDVALFGGATAGPVRWAPSNAAGEFVPGDLSESTPIANDKALLKSASDYYIVQIVADIDDEAWSDSDDDGVLSLPCPRGWEQGDADSGGLLNRAHTTAGGEDDEAFGCIEPKLPTILKTPVGAAQQDDPSKWAVTFDLTVTPNGTDTFYDLADVPDFVTGVNLISGSAQRLDAEGDPVGSPVNVALPVDGEAAVPFVTDVALGAAAAAHVWRVTWLVDVPNQILPPELRDCNEQGGGLDNQALLTVGDVTQTSDACIPVVPKVYPDMTKKVTGLSRDPETKVWEITYQIDVTLTDDEALNPKHLSSEYRLVEELDYPGVIDIEDASWTGHTTGDFAEDATSAVLAPKTGDGQEKIGAGETHTYIVTVHAKLAPGTITPNASVGCQTVNETRQIGFFNTATLTSDDLAPVVREACTPPVYPTMEKTPGMVTENHEDGTQRVVYLVTVTSPAPVAGQPVTNVIYSLKETPDALPSGVTLQGVWHAERVGDGPEPSAATWNGSGDWDLQTIAGFSAADRSAGKLVHQYRVWANVKVTSVPQTMPPACDDDGADGIPIWNTVTLAIGEQSISDDACVRVNYDDVKLVKTAGLPEGQTSVQPGDQFDYVLTVTNQGTREATKVRVTDATMNDRLEIVSISTPGFTFAGTGYTGNDVDLTLNEPLGAGESAVVTVRVRFLPEEVDDTPPFVEPGQTPPAPPAPIDVLKNTACVTADLDTDKDNNCGTVDVPARDITAVVYTTCQSDAAQLGFFVRTTGNLAALPVSGTWTTVDQPAVSGHSVSIAQFTAGPQGFGRVINWPGTAFTPSGVATDYPGWRALQASDYTADGQYINPSTGLPMTEDEVEDMIFNGLILDDSELDYAWRGETTIRFSVNPEITLTATYPPASAACVQARQSDVQIEKTASVDKTDPGKSFTYTLAVANVSDDSAADGVVVTDAIPADIKITDITWPGEGDPAAFPNWETCTVSGQDGAGYGGMLTCELFGPLQPVDATEGASAAPTITLTALVNPSSKASVITNVGVVDYYTFGNPEDAGHDEDDAVVALSALPATGGSPLYPLITLGFLMLLVGIGSVVVMRRRRGEQQLQL